jgi:hypothetical protein
LEAVDGLEDSRKFVDRLLGTAVSGLSRQADRSLRLLHPSEQQSGDLERFLRSAATKPLLPALAELADKKHRWVNALRIEGATQSIQSIERPFWRTNTDKIAKWSGLVEEGNPEFLMEHLKALSGRLAIRLTGQKAPTSELIALAVCHANCRQPPEGSDCWVSLESGFIIPVDDVRDLLPPLVPQEGNEAEKESRSDLIYVSTAPRRGLLFRFIEVKYRRHLRAARTPEVLQGIRKQVESLHKRWDAWYGHEDTCHCQSW